MDFLKIHLIFISKQELVLEMLVALPDLLMADSLFYLLDQCGVAEEEILLGCRELLQLSLNVLICKLGDIGALVRSAGF